MEGKILTKNGQILTQNGDITKNILKLKKEYSNIRYITRKKIKKIVKNNEIREEKKGEFVL